MKISINNDKPIIVMNSKTAFNDKDEWFNTISIRSSLSERLISSLWEKKVIINKKVISIDNVRVWNLSSINFDNEKYENILEMLYQPLDYNGQGIKILQRTSNRSTITINLGFNINSYLL